MRAPLAGLLERAARADRLCWAFTCYDAQTAVAVTQALEEVGVGGILLVSPQSFASPQGAPLLRALVAVAEGCAADVCVQLDHAVDLDAVESAFELGAGAAMADGSRLDLDDNVAFTRAAVEIASRFGGGIEAELGRIEGDEDVDEAAAAGALTDPAEAERFVERTGASCLAVSVGNVHGRYRTEPQLDWSRLEAIARRVDLPLALHGASGLPRETVERAARTGVVKVNVNTELRRRYLEVVADQLAAVTEGARLLDLQTALIEAMTELVIGRIRGEG